MFHQRTGTRMEVKEVLYLAILNKTNFDGYYSRLFLCPEGQDPEWYYLNRIDYEGCLKMVIKLNELFDDAQRTVLVPDLQHALVTQCAWCKRFKSASPEGDKWIELSSEEWGRWSATTHGICPQCAAKAKGE